MEHYPDWKRLIGAHVEVRRGQQLARYGVVDDAMPDSSIVWLAADGINRRTMYEAAEGYSVWVEPQQLSGEASYRMTTLQLYPQRA
ncbi:hypothetical protein J2X42_002537 [Arthrobacter sp. BE255]|nr:hypothetical protein [Arthrobacter sp. BE255]